MKKLVSILFLVISVFSFSAWEYYEKEGTTGIKPIKKILIVDGKKSLELNKDDEYVFSYYLDDKIEFYKRFFISIIWGG